MNSDRWDRLRSLYDRAEAVAPEEREAFVRRECAGDAELAEEVLDLLALVVPDEFIRPPIIEPGIDTEELPPLEGRQLGEFRVLRRIGSGGGGVVYLAEQPGLHRHVALKFLPRQGRDEKTLERFLRESKLAAALEHPHIVQVYGSGSDENFAWYAMRFVRGGDLAAELERQRAVQQGRFDGPLAWPPFDGPDYIAHAVERLAALAEAIQFAHDRRVVHRDVKPQNAMLDERGELLLTDFGIALDERFGTITQTGPMQGTPFYMSPEQLRALTDPVDHRTDIYSLGVVLYEALSLQKPFDGRTSQEVFERISRFEPKPLAHWNPRVPRDLATIVEKAMEQQPPWRYASAGELAADLRRFLRHESIVARPPSPAERLRRWARRKRTPLLLAAAVLLALWIGWFAATRASQRERYRAAQFTLDRGFTGDPRALPHAELVALRGQVEALARLRRDLPAELAATLERAERWFDEHRRAEIAELEAQRRSALGAPVPAVGPNVHREANVTDLAAFRVRAQRAADVHPFDTTLAALASEESTWPRLALRLHGRHPEIGGLERARVFLRPIDSYASAREAAIEVGAFPLRETAVRPGEYFVVVVMPGHFAELRRSLLPRLELYDFEVWLRPTSAVIDPLRMKEIPEGDVELRFPDAGHIGCFAAGTRTSVRAFHVDRAITSNGEFERYLQETGDAPPQLWTELGYRAPGQHQKAWEDLIAGYANWADLPAVGFTYPEALRYAEWRGMSLALHHEAERYLRGADGWLSPSEPPTGVPVPTAPGLVNAIDPRQSPSGEELDMYALYLSHALSVREPGYQQAPEGLFHALGNVAEYTASNVVERIDDQLYVAPHQVLILGASGWDSGTSGGPSGPISWRAHTKRGVDYAHVRCSIGIRCIKRAAP